MTSQDPQPIPLEYFPVQSEPEPEDELFAPFPSPASIHWSGLDWTLFTLIVIVAFSWFQPGTLTASLLFRQLSFGCFLALIPLLIYKVIVWKEWR